MFTALFRKKKMQPWEIPSLPGESASSHKERKRQAYFADQQENTLEWMRRMGFALDVGGMRVLDLGCGHGALSIRLAEEGAVEVVGVDLDDDRIDFAGRNLASRYPHLVGRVSFRCVDVMGMDEPFDLIVSKDSFEHIEDLGRVIRHVHHLLKPGGYLASGFSPLYYSPFGDHARFQLGVPWAHAVLPESALVWLLKQRRGVDVGSAMELGLNRLTPSEFRTILADGLEWGEVQIQYNRGDNPLFPVFNALRRAGTVEKYFTTSIYALARKRS